MKANVGFKILILICIVFAGRVVYAAEKLPQGVSLTDFSGTWVFERAEYLERSSPTSDYQVKYTINTPEGLEKLATSLHQAVKSISIDEVVHVVCPFTMYCGRAALVTLNDKKGTRYLLTVGVDPADMGKESPLPGLFFNAAGLDYWIERIDAETIAITKEAVDIVNSVATYSAVRCIMKKNN